MNAQHTPTVTQADAIKFCNRAMRNWQYVSFDEDELEDLRVELQRHREQSQAELLECVEALGAMPEGYCFCSENRIGDDSKRHEPECADLRAAIAKARGVQP